jgi:Fe-S oxidoreductase
LLLAAAVLREREKQIPRALSFLLPETGFNLMKAVEAVQIMPEQRPWITDATAGPLAPARTVLFTGCTGIMQPDLVMTALDMIRRLDPTVQALGGIDYCCGDTTLRAGRPESAREQFRQLVEGLDAFSPEEVVFLCPTCKMYFDQFGPKTQWPWHFITHYLADRLDELGPFSEVDATVTIHDACHLVRGEKGEWTSPRALLQSIPGIRVLEMENSRDQALCCGATAMASIGRAGAELRAYRLRQAEKTGAEVMAVYCPACQSIFAPQGPKVPFQIQSIISLVGRAMGIAHEDKLQHYLSYGDPQRVLSEAAHCIMASRLPEEALRGFCLKFFR